VCEPARGSWSLSQPTVPPLFDCRALAVTLARWSRDARDECALVEDALRREVHPRVAPGVPFETFLVNARRAGYVESVDQAPPAPAHTPGPAPAARAATPPAGLALVLYPKVGLRDGSPAHNPWLQELPDPISHIAWDNYATLSPARAQALELTEGQVVRVRCAERDEPLELPLHVQPGQHDDVVGIALGYGRAGTDRFAAVAPRWLQGEPTIAPGAVLGVNAAPWLVVQGGLSRRDVRVVEVEPTSRHHELAATQDYQRLELPPHLAPAGHEVRDVLRRTTLEELSEPPHAAPHHAGPGLWPEDHPRVSHAWGMAIDLTACFGCGACVVGCQAENNVPVVGRDEVRRHREMHWLRVDRYYTGDGDDLRVAHQPMLCQHCDNAPCEAVCPVLATVHSSDGLNQQVYNRCVGTRYCANTCPYKVRRFNWFDYPREDELANHALNPDVAVRTRGVMEKCSMCAQRIQAARSAAHRSGAPIADGALQTACQQSCPTRAIVFGDMSDPESEVNRALRSPRAYHALEELNVRPSVAYLAEVRNAPRTEPRHG
jgi:molybdopterin-containing oxidoreductase family iron-sulfur binding subunit